MGTEAKTEIQLSPINTSRSHYPVKYALIVVFLAFCVVCFMLYNRNFNDQRSFISDGSPCIITELKKNPTTILDSMIPTISSKVTEDTNDPSVCSFHSVRPEHALEVKFVKESIAWPETPSVPSNFSLDETSDPAHSTFTILPRNNGGSWHVEDQMEVLIKIFDFLGRPKKSGGDFLYARLGNNALSAGVAGKVLDHRNGSYTAIFSLLWEGSAQVEVSLVHPSEAVTVLERVTEEQPGRAIFISVFRLDSVTETVKCSVCLNAPKEKLCNYTDLHTGEPWFCYKPKELSCNTRISHARGGFTLKTEPREKLLFQLGKNMKVSIPASGPTSVNILPKLKDGSSESIKTEPAGYYYKGSWRALDGTTVRQFNNGTAISQCLKGKVVHLYGDSTVRQWFEYLIAKTPDLKTFDLKSPGIAGPYMALDYKKNTLLTYRCHGTPILYTPIPASQTRHVATELRTVIGGTNTVVVISLWAHFTTFPIEVYIQRFVNIRKEVVQLLNRAPGTLVIIRTANPKASVLNEIWTSSDWYAIQLYKVVRAIFKGVNVRLVDAWEMCVAHHLPHSLHPQPPIIKNMVDVVLSHICPTDTKKGKTNR